MINSNKTKKISCYTPEQQMYYEKLVPRQRSYIDFRSQGYGKADSYRKAGYRITKNAGQNAYILERSDPMIKELIETRVKVRQAKEVLKADSEIGKQIDALAEVKTAEQTLEVLNNADAETIKQIQFYRDIISGKIQTVKRTTFTNSLGKKSYKEEKISDVDAKMKARKELDRILGLNSIVDIGKIETGDITINIVDASKKDALEDERNKVVIDVGETEENVDGEVVIIQEEKNQKSKVSNKGSPSEEEESEMSKDFFEKVGGE